MGRRRLLGACSHPLLGGFSCRSAAEAAPAALLSRAGAPGVFFIRS
jgi:hypothetical protein